MVLPKYSCRATINSDVRRQESNPKLYMCRLLEDCAGTGNKGHLCLQAADFQAKILESSSPHGCTTCTATGHARFLGKDNKVSHTCSRFLAKRS